MTKTNETYVYKRTDGRWEARYIKGFDKNGKKIFGAVYAKTKEEAIKRRNEKTGATTNTGEKAPTELNLLILGAGTHGNDIKEIAESLRIFKKISFLDDNLAGDNILGKCVDVRNYRSEYPCAFIAIGNNKIRKKFTKLLKELNFLMPNIISHAATVSPNAKLGEGIAIMPQATVGAATIGDGVILDANSLVNSDATIGDYVHLDCGAMVLKGKTVPENTKIKSGEVFR